MMSDSDAKQAGDLSHFPGGDLVAKGLADLARHIRSDEALLVLIAEPRLRVLGFEVPQAPSIPMPYEHVLFTAIENRNPDGAHAAYNALIGRIVSFANSYRPGTAAANCATGGAIEHENPENRQLE